MPKVAIDIDADIQPVSDFRANAAALLKQVQESGRPMILTQRGRSAAVLLDVQSFQSLLEELDELRDVQRGLADVQEKRTTTHADARQKLLQRYK